MKAFNIIGLAVAALSCASVATAQDEAKPAAPKIKAIVLLPSDKKPKELVIERAVDKDNFVYIDTSIAQEMQASVSSCRPFVIQTPADLAAALNTFREGDLAAARKQAASVKKKYAAYAGLPGSPTTIAALTELSCAVRLQDWAAAKSLAASFPAADSLEGVAAMRVQIAGIMGDISDSPKSLETQKAAIEELLKDKKAAKAINSELYGWLRYALGRAYAARITAEELQNGIPDDKVKAANEAVDNLCQCVASIHGSQAELPVDALNRAMTILWAMPSVKAYKAPAANEMTKQAWASAPADFKDAVAIANLLKTVYAPGEANELADKLAPLFYNTGKDKPKQEEAAK